MRACVRSCVRACVRYTCVLRLDRNGLSVSHSLLRSFFGSTSREGRPSIPPLSGVPPLGQTERPRSIYLAYGSLPGKTLKISPFVSPFLRTSPCFLRAMDSFLPSFAPQRVRTVVNKRRPTLRRLFPRFRNPFAISRKSFSRNGVSSNAFSMGTSGTRGDSDHYVRVSRFFRDNFRRCIFVQRFSFPSFDACRVPRREIDRKRIKLVALSS